MGSKRKNMKTLKQGTKDDESASETKTISFPIEIIQEIISWLPVKPLLQFKSVSKPWLSVITNNPSFPKLHFTHSLAKNRTALFIPAYDKSTSEQHFLSAPNHGGPVTHLITLPNVSHVHSIFSEFQHVNGLILFTSSGNVDMNSIGAFVINPATRNTYKLPTPPYDAPPITGNYKYKLSEMYTFFGFDESINEHKVLNIRVISNRYFNNPYRKIIEIMVFSLSDYSWTKIHVKENEFAFNISCGNKTSVCVNSVIHMSLQSRDSILAFDLTTYKFRIVKIPDDAIPDKLTSTYYKKRRMNNVKSNLPFLMKTNGLFVLACHHRVLETNEMEIWILQDYQNGVWVKETVAFSKSWIELDNPNPSDFLSKNEIVFSLKRLPKNRISVPVYDIKTGKFKSVKFSLGPQLLHSDTLMFNDVISYVESVLRLKGNETGTSSSS